MSSMFGKPRNSSERPPQSPLPECNVAILGCRGAGKSALTVKFLTKRFISEYDPNLEDTYSSEELVDQQPVLLKVMDTADQDGPGNCERYLCWASAFLVVYSIDNRKSFEGCQRYLEVLALHARGCQRRCPVLLLGNKLDMEQYRAGMGRCYLGALWEGGVGCMICHLHLFWVAAVLQGILHPSPPVSPGRCSQQKGCPSPAGLGASSMRCQRARISLGCSTSSTRPCGRCGAKRNGTSPCGHSSSLRSGPACPWPRRWPCPPTTAWPPAPSTPSPLSTTRKSPRWPRPSWSPSSPHGLRAKGRLPRSPC
ncbi:ras-like protein family member 12 isoform X1 [Lonchura striata]